MKKQSAFLPCIILMMVLLTVPGLATGRQESRSERLIFFMNYPYQIWSDDFTKIHLTLLKPDFQPAKGAIVKVNDKEMGKTDANGVCIFDSITNRVIRQATCFQLS